MTATERLDKHDKQIAAIRSLWHEGMRLMVETRKDIRALAAAQKRTEQSLQRLIDMRGRQRSCKTKPRCSIGSRELFT